MKAYPNWQKKDPAYKSEAKKYERPLPSREFLEQIFRQEGTPLATKDIVKALELPRNMKIALSKRLNAMERDGVLLRNRREGYCLVGKISVIAGVPPVLRCTSKQRSSCMVAL